MAVRLPMQMPTAQGPLAAPSYGSAPQAAAQPMATAQQRLAEEQMQIQKALEERQLTLAEKSQQAARLTEEGRLQTERDRTEIARAAGLANNAAQESAKKLTDAQREEYIAGKEQRKEATALGIAAQKETILGAVEARRVTELQADALATDNRAKKVRDTEGLFDALVLATDGLQTVIMRGEGARRSTEQALKDATMYKDLGRKLSQQRMAIESVKMDSLARFAPPQGADETKEAALARMKWDDDEEMKKELSRYPVDLDFSGIPFFRAPKGADNIIAGLTAEESQQVLNEADDWIAKRTKGPRTQWSDQDQWDDFRVMKAQQAVDKRKAEHKSALLSSGADAMINLVKGNRQPKKTGGGGMSSYMATREAVATRIGGDRTAAAAVTAAMDVARYSDLARGGFSGMSKAAGDALYGEMVADGMVADSYIPWDESIRGFAQQKYDEALRQLKMHATSDAFGGDLGAVKILSLLEAGAEQLKGSQYDSYLASAHRYLSSGFAQIPDSLHGGAAGKDGKVVGTELFKGAFYSMNDKTTPDSILGAVIKVAQATAAATPSEVQIIVSKYATDLAQIRAEVLIAIRKAEKDGRDPIDDPAVVAKMDQLRNMGDDLRAIIAKNKYILPQAGAVPPMSQGDAAAALR